ncbi:MAG TPA: hypothetical protein VG944_14680 [Fimbriimonas sp.]|nr:hypothetical protein [Fimbriimonas sp.]
MSVRDITNCVDRQRRRQICNCTANYGAEFLMKGILRNEAKAAYQVACELIVAGTLSELGDPPLCFDRID